MQENCSTSRRSVKHSGGVQNIQGWNIIFRRSMYSIQEGSTTGEQHSIREHSIQEGTQLSIQSG